MNYLGILVVVAVWSYLFFQIWSRAHKDCSNE